MRLATCLLVLLAAQPLLGQEPVKLVSDPALSPEGSTLAFAWRGDIWLAPASGGNIRQLTRHESIERQPFFSPDGNRIAFISERSGSRQVWLIPVEGGIPEQVTHHTAGHSLHGWFPDGRSLLIRRAADTYWRNPYRFWKFPLTGTGPAKMLFDAMGNHGDVSPDGTKLLFTREGEREWRKGYTGPRARQVWMFDMETQAFKKLVGRQTESRWPLWMRDGKGFYYVGGESGSFNLRKQTIRPVGSSPVTYYPDDSVSNPALSRNGSTIVFGYLFDLYRFPPGSDSKPERIDLYFTGDTTGFRRKRKIVKKATAAAFTNDGLEIVIVAGGDLWVMDTVLKEPRRITDTPGEEREPVFSKDRKAIYFISDRNGRSDLWVARPADPKKYWWRNTAFTTERLTDDDHLERGLSLSPNGKSLAFIRAKGDLVVRDIKTGKERVIFSSWNGPSYDWSPDGKWFVYAVYDDDYNRDIWIAPVDGSRKAVNVSRHPDNESNPSWSPDGKMIAFTGRRSDKEVDIYYLWLTREDHATTSRERTLEKALEAMKKSRKKKPEKKTEKGTENKPPEKKPVKTPKKMPPRKKPEKDPGNISPGMESPATESAHPKMEAYANQDDPLTGAWIGTIVIKQFGIEAQFTVDLKLDGTRVTGRMTISMGRKSTQVPLEGTFRNKVVTVSGSEDGKTYEFTMTLVAPDHLKGSVQGQGAEGPVECHRSKSETASTKANRGPGAVKPVEIDFEDIHRRLRRISIADASESELFWSHDSKKLAFRATIKGKKGTWTVSMPTPKNPAPMSTSTVKDPRWIAKGNQVVCLVDGVPASLGATGSLKKYPFQVRQEVDLVAHRREGFFLAWRAIRDIFYDERMGNRDWNTIKKKYGEAAANAPDATSFGGVINMMLGELNASHLGFSPSLSSPSGQGWKDVTPHLGIRWDRSHPGPGLRILDIVPGTPADRAVHELEAGGVIAKIDGKNVGPGTNLAILLNGRLDRNITLTVVEGPEKTRDVTLRPIAYTSIHNHLYNKWIRDNLAKVERASDGTLGYLHVRSMNWTSFLTFERELYSAGAGKDGLVIDVRENGGGFTADYLLTALTQPLHAITVGRGGGPGYPQDRKVYASWNKPIVVLCNQNSFSNAEIFAHAIKTLKRGKVVGVRTAGGVISTSHRSIMDLGNLRTPLRGWYVLGTGEDMERNGAVPDVILWPAPGDMPAGRDEQLTKAIEVLSADVRAWKARPRPKLRKASERGE